LTSAHIKTIESGEIVIWDKGVYRRGGRRKIETLCQELADDQHKIISNSIVSEIIGIIRRRTQCKFEDFDKEPMQMSFLNGILDLESLTLRPRDPEFLTLVQIPCKYNPAASCPGIEKAVEEIVGAENTQLIWEILGHCLVKEYLAKRFPVFVGQKDSGKSTLLNLMSAFLGKENISAVSMQNLSDRFMKAELAGKLANISDDLPKGRVKDSSMLKRLSGQSRIQAEEKGKDPFGFVNHAKLIFSSNYLPRVDNPTDADFRRFMIIELHNKFGGTDIGAKPKDPTLLKKLITPGEMSGLLNKALEGIRRLRANNWEFSYRLTENQVAAIMLGIENHGQHEYYDNSHIPFSQEKNCGRDCRIKNKCKRSDTIATLRLEWE
jgi:putative DNA primase/helicase